MARRVLVGALVALLRSVVLAGTALAARPPAPAGAQILAPGQVPTTCPAGAVFDAYGSNYGYYFSQRANAWISAPWCYPRWGNLEASASGVVAAGQAFTVTAIPTDGSNSATYAPQTQSITWRFPGKAVAGCGNADLSCTVIPTTEAGDEWSWFEFNVSMPRTFFLNSPGEFCAGIPICGGVRTQAWAFVGVPPDDGKLHIRGSVRDVEGNGVAGVRVTAAGPTTKSARTDASGSYDLVVRKGTYAVSAAGGWCVVGRPGCTRTVRVTLAPSRTVDFAPPPEHTLSGSIFERTCAETCTQTGLEGVRITATGGPGGPETTTTAPDGTYALTLSEGTWRIEPSQSGRAFEHVDARGEGDGQPSVSVPLRADRSGVDFKTCAEEDAEPGADDPPAALARRLAARGCKHLKVEVIRVRAAGDAGWTESSGKKLLGNARIPVGFAQPTSDGEFRWQCRTGCLNVRIRVTDRETGRPVPSATVAVSVLAAPGAVTTDTPNGVVCPAQPYAQGCAERIERQLDRRRDLDVHYWLPGVIERTNARIYVQVRAPGYVRAKRTQNVVVVPNAPVKRTITLRRFEADRLLWWGSLKRGLAFADLGSYCDKAIAGLNELAGGNLPAGTRTFLTTYVVKLVKQLDKGCGLLQFGQLVDKLNVATPWVLYTTFVPLFKVPRNGLLGTSNIVNRPAQFALNFAGFFDAFNNGLVEYLYDRVDLTNPVAPSLVGNPLRLEIFEVSHRQASGKVKDALYVRFTGKQQGTPTKTYGALAEGGYYPGCWLNPRLNEAEFSVFDLNPCRTEEP